MRDVRRVIALVLLALLVVAMMPQPAAGNTDIRGASPDPTHHPVLTYSMVAAVFWEAQMKGVGKIPITGLATLQKIGYTLEPYERDRIVTYLNRGFRLEILWGPIAIGKWAGVAWQGTDGRGNYVYGLLGEISDHDTAHGIAAGTATSAAVKSEAEHQIAQTLALNGIAIAAGMAFFQEGLAVAAGAPVIGVTLMGLGVGLITIGTIGILSLGQQQDTGTGTVGTPTSTSGLSADVGIGLGVTGDGPGIGAGDGGDQ